VLTCRFGGHCSTVVISLILALSGIFTAYECEVIFLLCERKIGRNFCVEFMYRNSLKIHSVINYLRCSRNKKGLPTGTRATPRIFLIGCVSILGENQALFCLSELGCLVMLYCVTRSVLSFVFSLSLYLIQNNYLHIPCSRVLLEKLTSKLCS